MEKTITHINIFQIEYTFHLLIISEHLSNPTADLYEIELKKRPNFWLKQKIRLSDPAENSAFTTYTSDYFLAIPQKSLESLLIYKFSNHHFIPYKNLTSIHVDQVISFNIGHKSFLAFNGLQASIYQFGPNGLKKEIVKDSNLDGVNYWLPIPINTYRDETILMGQRFLNHEPHESVVIEIFIYNGVKFEEHEDVSCFYFGELVTGLSCLPGEDVKKGISGGVSFLKDYNLGLLIPRRGGNSEIFFINTEFRKVVNPIDHQLGELYKQRDYLDV